jgi:NAD(P)H-hydrate epimerase
MREPHSHKGENGIVAIVGGSEAIHGAPLLSALAAEASGVDLVFVAVPRCHAQLARQTALNFQVRGFEGDELLPHDVEPLLQWLATMDACVIGPGLARTKETLDATYQLIAGCPCTMVLDASALQPWTLEAARGHEAVLLPHLGELERMGLTMQKIGPMVSASNQVIHVKGHSDTVTLPNGTVREVAGGNAGLTVGGTGDVLAGLTAGLIAQHYPRTEASIIATTIIKKAGDVLAEEQGTFRAIDVIERIPKLLKDIAGDGSTGSP